LLTSHFFSSPCTAPALQSKSTPLGAVVKFAAGGKARAKKDLAMLAMETYGQDVYVASVCLEANYNQVRGSAEQLPACRPAAACCACCRTVVSLHTS
jgi:hypothetical protein